MGLAEENLPKQGFCLVTGLLYTCICGAGGKSVGLIAPIGGCLFVFYLTLPSVVQNKWCRILG